jgi:hypothetical protein
MAGLLYVLMIAQFPDKSTKTLVKMPSYPPVRRGKRQKPGPAQSRTGLTETVKKAF